MPPELPVIWSPQAKTDLEHTANYLAINWNGKVMARFFLRLSEAITLIGQNPEQFPVILRSKQISRMLLSRQNSIYYRVRNGQVEIIRLFDNRQNPAKWKR